MLVPVPNGTRPPSSLNGTPTRCSPHLGQLNVTHGAVAAGHLPDLALELAEGGHHPSAAGAPGSGRVSHSTSSWVSYRITTPFGWPARIVRHA